MIREKAVRKEQIILYQGEAVYGVQVIRCGMVRAYTILSNGSEVNVALYGPGDYFPVETAYDTAPGTLFYYEALTDGTIATMNEQEFRAERAANPQTSYEDSKRYVGALLHVNALGQATAYDKLGHSLRYLAMRFGEPLSGKGFYRIGMKLTQQDLANLCTMSRETVSIELAQLKAKKAVIEKTKLYTVNVPLLNQLLGDEDFSPLQL
jgi:CRP-like cAMP-binding protein